MIRCSNRPALHARVESTRDYFVRAAPLQGGDAADVRPVHAYVPLQRGLGCVPHDDHAVQGPGGESNAVRAPAHAGDPRPVKYHLIDHHGPGRRVPDENLAVPIARRQPGSVWGVLTPRDLAPVPLENRTRGQRTRVGADGEQTNFSVLATNRDLTPVRTHADAKRLTVDGRLRGDSKAGTDVNQDEGLVRRDRCFDTGRVAPDAPRLRFKLDNRIRLV